MIRLIPAAERHFSDIGWLRTYWLFSFSDYHDPENVRFGMLRVFNDDVVQPGQGFPMHPHREMEIVTIPLSGYITHADSLGNRTSIGPGDVQRMSGGTGITHSEFNMGADPVHLYQIWIFPDRQELAPSYDQRHFDADSWQGRLLPVASGQGLPEAVTLHADASIYRSRLTAGQRLLYPDHGHRGIFVYLTDGRLQINDTPLAPGDQARITDENTLVLEALEECEFVLIDVPA
jgi:redox-sensitive bicupin YhaK (pirin superfamily)